MAESRIIELTDGNIRNSHFYLAEIKDWIPSDTYGASTRKKGMGVSMSLEFAGGAVIHSDVGTEASNGHPRNFFRERRPVAAFFARHCLGPGDRIKVERLGERSLRISPA